jgi:hypothetical protein
MALDALIIALAPVFAAGFAIQKLLEISDSAFSLWTDFTAKILDKRLEDKKPGEPDKKPEEQDKSLGLLPSRKITRAENNLNDQSTEDKSEAKEKVDQEKKEFKKSLKVLWTGLAAIIIGYWIVSSLHISVLTPILNINATTGAISSSNPISIDPFWDKFITVFFIAAGTEGVNSILKYLGYAKEQKQSGEGENTE